MTPYLTPYPLSIGAGGSFGGFTGYSTPSFRGGGSCCSQSARLGFSTPSFTPNFSGTNTPNFTNVSIPSFNFSQFGSSRSTPQIQTLPTYHVRATPLVGTQSNQRNRAGGLFGILGVGQSRLDAIQLTVGIGGATPGIGIFADIANVGIDLLALDFGAAVIDGFAAVPGVGLAGAPLAITKRLQGQVPISVDEALKIADDFLDLGTPIKTIDSKAGVQFIQESIDAQGRTITKRAGFDLNKASGHVQKRGEHLNLQTQIYGKVQTNGPSVDPHTPIDPRTIRSGDF